MTPYVDENFYKQNYLCGRKAVINTAFEFYANKATIEVNKYTFGNIDVDNVPEGVKNCCCELAELIYREENKVTGVISEKVGDLSKSYESAESQRQLLSKNIKSVIYSWLSGTGLLYRGVDR